MYKKFNKPGVGHNSVQTPHNGVYTPYNRLSQTEQEYVIEETFRRRERMLVRSERHRRIREGIIIPASAMQPTPIVKRPDGSWAIGIETYI
jgi:hypothetical protein